MTTPKPDVLLELEREFEETKSRLARCTDLFGKMLLTGKLNRLQREWQAARPNRRSQAKGPTNAD